eukprot:CAMPEP_0169482280 /NCGR_PEP_ID=MMETSP1042-20121227/30593_1 /TAXON_ID=464988 /ORGANISM="Hemiselmis andersenii, Strain CCMP1180" /LENGTH=46 /DNA_ID= /DNA_START= /DNA_END= /DNA_ORIENTATION=
MRTHSWSTRTKLLSASLHDAPDRSQWCGKLTQIANPTAASLSAWLV